MLLSKGPLGIACGRPTHDEVLSWRWTHLAWGWWKSSSPRLRGVCIGFHVGAWQVISKLGLGAGHGSGSSHTRRQSLP